MAGNALPMLRATRPPPGSSLAHQKLDRAVRDAYGWGHEIGDEEILERLLALNLERAGKGR